MTQLTEQIRVRCTPAEKAEVEAEAQRAGVKAAVVIRARLFGKRRAPIVGDEETDPRAQSVVADATRRQAEDQSRRITLEDYQAQRVPQLVGAGMTTPVARAEAAAEFRAGRRAGVQ